MYLAEGLKDGVVVYARKVVVGVDRESLVAELVCDLLLDISLAV